MLLQIRRQSKLMYRAISVWKTMVSGPNMVRWNDNRRHAYLLGFFWFLFLSSCIISLLFSVSLYLFLFACVSLFVSVIFVLLSLFLIFSLTVTCIRRTYCVLILHIRSPIFLLNMIQNPSSPPPPWLEKAECSERQHLSDIQLFNSNYRIQTFVCVT